MSTAPDLSHLCSEPEARFGAAILPGARLLWTGERSGGRAAAFRALIERASREGERIALVDAGRVLEASAWCSPAGPLAGAGAHEAHEKRRVPRGRGGG